jgi:hypothetical protein
MTKKCSRNNTLVHDNEDALVQSAQQSRDQLERLFEADSAMQAELRKSKGCGVGVDPSM